jgi:hypothetical protein
MRPSRSRWRIATRANEPPILRRSMRMDCEMNLKVGTSLKIRSNVGLSSVMACWALSLTLPLDHFFFFADLPPPDEDGAGALALGGCETRERRCQDPFRPPEAHPGKGPPSIGKQQGNRTAKHDREYVGAGRGRYGQKCGRYAHHTCCRGRSDGGERWD